VTEFAPTLSNCSTTGALALCTLTSVTSEGLPWTLMTTGPRQPSQASRSRTR
jgi:hypothetical protein